jgi:ribosome-binding factor A
LGRMRKSTGTESQRQLRVGEQIRHCLADLLMRGQVHEPELSEVSLTISEVRVSRDLRRAEVFLTELGGGLRASTRAALERAAPHLRGEVTRRSRLKYAPDLVFTADTSFDQAARIDALLEEERDQIERQREGGQ